MWLFLSSNYVRANKQNENILLVFVCENFLFKYMQKTVIVIHYNVIHFSLNEKLSWRKWLISSTKDNYWRPRFFNRATSQKASYVNEKSNYCRRKKTTNEDVKMHNEFFWIGKKIKNWKACYYRLSACVFWKLLTIKTEPTNKNKRQMISCNGWTWKIMIEQKKNFLLPTTKRTKSSNPLS